MHKSDTPPWSDPRLSLDERVDALLAELTLAEKVGQLGSFWAAPQDESAVSGDVAPMEGALSKGLSWEESIAHGLGHLTRNYGTEPVSVADGLATLRDRQRRVVDASRLGIPAIVHEECLTGFTALGATVYPAAIAWGASFDPELVEEMAAAIGADLAAVGVHQGLSPLLDVVRDYRWGRVEETCGEDPYVVGTLGTAYVRGLQRAGVVATLKHFAGYPASRAGRNHAPVPMGRRELEDVMLPPFEMAVRAGGVGSVMNSYSDVDGVPAAASVDLLTTTLRERWGFEGTVVSDYWSVVFLTMMHRVAADDRSAGVLALTAGIDVELPNTGCYEQLVAAVEAGEVPEALVDRACRRVLRQKIALGLLDADFAPEAVGGERDLDSAGNRAIARRLAESSIVLCANDGVLPLRSGVDVALVGPCAAEPRSFMGCYSFPNHVLSRYADRADTLGVRVDSLLDALRAELGQSVVTHAAGVPILDLDDSGIAAAVEAAAQADVAVVTVGDLAGLFGLGTSGEGCDSVDLRLPGLQERLVTEILDTGTPVVLVVVSGRPYALGAVAGRCAAVVQAFMPGEEGGAAIAGVLSGRVNPSGRLPVGLPDHPGGQPGTYLVPSLGWFSEGVSNLDPRPLYPFGHGLAYTTFELSDLHLSAAEVAPDGVVEASVVVANTGARAGSHVVQLYLRDEVAQVTRPVHQLIGYVKVALEPGQRRRVTFEVHMDRTSFVGVDYTRIVEPGEFTLLAGSSSTTLDLEATFTVTGNIRVVAEGRVLTTPTRIQELP